MKLPPIQPGEVYVRCPSCRTIGWTHDRPDEPLPICPYCGTRSEQVAAGGLADVRLIDGPPPDPLHHLS